MRPLARAAASWTALLARLSPRPTRTGRRQARRLHLSELERRDVMTAGNMMAYAWGSSSGAYVSDDRFYEGPYATYTVSLTLIAAPSDGSPVTIHYWTTDGTARGKTPTDSLAGKDYQAVDATETFPDTSHLPSLVFAVYDDSDIEVAETFKVHFECTSGNATLSNSEIVLTILDNDTPAVSTKVNCECEEGDDPPTNAPDPANEYPVRYSDGAVVYSETDLTAGGGGLSLDQARSWSNADGSGLGSPLGGGWTANSLPRLVELDGGNTLVSLRGSTTVEFFDLMSGVYVERAKGGSTLTHNSGAKQFILTTAGGTVTRYDDFDATRKAGRWGAFFSQKDRAGNVAEATAWDDVGRVTRVEREAGDWTDALVYTYGPSGASGGRLTSVALERDDGTSGFLPVRSIEYGYYDGTSDHGRSGDLRSATEKDAAGTPVGTTYYRYYKTATFDGLTQIGYAGGLKFAFRQADYARLAADAESIGGTGAEVDDLTDEEIQPYAGNYFEYDSSKRVTKEIAAGAGCSACAGGLGEFTHAYTASSNSPGPNSWAVKTVVTQPDGTVETVYTNERGNVMLKATATGGQTWLDYWQYNADDQVVLHASPSAVSGYDDYYADLVNIDIYGNAQYLRDGEGLVTAYSYYASTTSGIDEDTAGGVEGYQEEIAVRRGETGTDVPQQSWTYFARTTGDGTTYPVATSTVYRNDDGTGGQTTSYAYEWYSGQAQAYSVTTTLPTVTTAQNGPNSAVTSVTVYDAMGRAVWTKDPGGFLSYTEYDDATGGVVKAVTDVNTGSPYATLPGEPSGWATPGGGGLHLTTEFEVDDQGRTTKTTSPEGRVTFTVFDDENHEVRTYPGWDSTLNSGAGGPTGPTTVTRDDRAGGYTETLTMSATPAVSGGRPTGAESIGSIQSLTRTYRNPAGQAVYTDTYFNLSGLTYSTSTSLGTEGTHFYRTYQGYNQQGKPTKTVSPAGTIARTERDGLGRVVSEWVGTDDTPSTGYWSVTNLTGTDMVKVRGYEYDGGGVGDSLLTQVTEYPGAGQAAQVTQTWFDWRGRAVVTKGGVETTEDGDVNRPLTYTDYDNLGHVTRTRTYDGDHLAILDRDDDGVPDAPDATGFPFAIGGTDTQEVHGVATDADGNVYVAGSFQGTVDFDPGAGTTSLTSAGGSDAFVAKYSPAGALVWAHAIGGSGDEVALDVDASADGDVRAVGTFTSSSLTVGSSSLTNAGGTDLFVWALDTDGTTDWGAWAGGSTSYETARSVAIGPSGETVVGGWFVADVVFGSGATVWSASASADAFVWKLDAAGATSWVAKSNGSGLEYGTGVAVDETGAIYLAGFFYNSTTWAGTSLTTAGAADVVLWKLTSAGATSWVAQAGGTGEDVARGVAAIPGGGAYVTGYFSGTATFGGASVTSAGNIDAFVWKVDGSATTAWAVGGGGSTGDRGERVAADADGNAIVAGWVGSSNATFGGVSAPSAYSWDALTWKLDGAAGATAWVRTAGGAVWPGIGDDYDRDVAVDGSGNAYAVGSFVGNPSFGGTTLTATGRDGFVWAVQTPLRSDVRTEYDELGRAFRTRTYGVDPATGQIGANPLTSQVWFDKRGNAIKSSAPGGLVRKWAYDGAGRATAQYLSDGGGDSGWADADDVTGDTVLSQSETAYDWDVLPIASTTRERFHDASGTGALGSPSSGVGARVSYATTYYDPAGRLTAAVDVGTNGGSAYTRPGSVPTGSASVLVSAVEYDAAGRAWKQTDPAGRETRTTFDALGRVTKTVQNYVDGTVSDADDKTTEYAYGPAGVTAMTVRLTGGGSQTTEWVYGSATATLHSNDVQTATKWPDPTTGAASGGEQDTVTVDAQGKVLTRTDRNGTTHTYTYDVLGRVTVDAVTTLGGGVDGAVRRVETAYDSQGNPYLVTGFDAATSGNVVTQVKRTYNGLGQLTAEWQSASGAVTATTPVVRYAYSEMAGGANHSRLVSTTYPGGYVLTQNYASGLNSNISRLTSLSDANGTLESYDYLGLGTVVTRAHAQPGLDLTYVKQGAEPNGAAGDQYAGLDAFGRVTDQRWIKSGTAVSRYQYGYDAAGNRTYRDDLVGTGFDEKYAYDGLDQLTGYDRGTLSGGSITSQTATNDWAYDSLGNWAGVDVDGNGTIDTDEDRTHNAQNEITGIDGATTPTYDANGNLTTDETGRQFVYDAWNRLVKVKDSGGTLLKTYGYDGLGRRVSDAVNGGTTTTLVYDSSWRVLEERVSGVVQSRYVWSPVYVDALVLRDRDTDANGTLDERLYAVQDANWNVVALVNTSGTVVERFAYDPYGAVTVLDGSFGSRGSSSYGWKHGFQGMAFDGTAGLNMSRGRSGYSPTLGRWVSVDPIEYSAGDQNLYRFVGNGPTVGVDPSGLWSWQNAGYGLLAGAATAVGVVAIVGTGGLATPLVIAGGAALGSSLAGSYAQTPGQAVLYGATGGMAVGMAPVAVPLLPSVATAAAGAAVSVTTGSFVTFGGTSTAPAGPLNLGQIVNNSVADDALVNFGSVPRGIIDPTTGCRSYWFRFDTIKHLTMAQIRAVIGDLASAGQPGGAGYMRVSGSPTGQFTQQPSTNMAGVPEFTADVPVPVLTSIPVGR